MKAKLAELEREKGEEVVTVQVPVEAQRFRRLSVEERVEIVRKLYFDGLTYDQIAKILRISPRDIAKAIRGEKIAETEKDKLRAEIRDEADKLRAEIQKLRAEIQEYGQKIRELEDRLNRASVFVRATFGHFTAEYSDLFESQRVSGDLDVFCPYCRKFVHLTYIRGKWVCERCHRVPF